MLTKLHVMLIALGGAVAVGCGPVPPPAPPPVIPTAIRAVGALVRSQAGQGIAGATCRLQDTPGWVSATSAGSEGYLVWPSVLASLTTTQVECSADGYLPFSAPRNLATDLDPAGNLAPLVLVPALPSAGESGRVHVDGLVFRREDGSIFPWRGAIDFSLFRRFLTGEDIQSILTERICAGTPPGEGCDPARWPGANVVVVLGMVNSFAHFWPQEHANYYAQLGPFLDLVAARGLRAEFIPFADAQIIMPDAAAERAHLQRVADVLAPHWNVFVSTVNEPFQNIPGGDATAVSLCHTIQGRGFPVASGAYTDWSMTPCDYATIHTERKAEWPRTAKDVYEMRNAQRVPVVADEPTGFAEVADGDRRSTNAADGAYYAATAALEGAGSTFHSDAGIRSQPWGPVQRAAAAAWYAAARWVPVEAQLAPYTRGGTQPGCKWEGESIAEHDDARELRSFAKVIGDAAWLVQIRTTRAAVAPCGPWQVVDVLRPGIVRVRR